MRLLSLLPVLLAPVLGCAINASADTLPVGTYSISAHTTTTGIHQSVDQGTLSGTLTFSAASILTVANLIFNDVTTGAAYTFTVPGATEFIPQEHLLDATIYNNVNPTIRYYFSVRTYPINGAYVLTCGTDCHTDAIIPDATGRSTLSEELDGNITPTAVTPEPSSMLFVSTGILAAAGALRRRPACA